MCTIIHIHDPLATPWHVNWKLKINNWKLWGGWFPLPRGGRWGRQQHYIMKVSYLPSVLPCQCQGVNANHYIAEIGACCTLKSVFSEPETVKIACAFSEKGRCVFQKSHMRFWKKGHAISWRCTWGKFSIANVKKQCTEWKKTVHWIKVNSVLNRKIQCIVFIRQ